MLKFESFLLLLKNKYLNLPNEDLIICALEFWISRDKNWIISALEYDSNEQSEDNGFAYNQMMELINNINWPVVSLNALLKIVTAPYGYLK